MQHLIIIKFREDGDLRIPCKSNESALEKLAWLEDAMRPAASAVNSLQTDFGGKVVLRMADIIAAFAAEVPDGKPN